MKYKIIVNVGQNYDIEVEAEDDFDAEEKGMEEAKKMFEEFGIVDPTYDVEVIDEILE